MKRRDFEKAIALGVLATAIPGAVTRAGTGSILNVFIGGAPGGADENAVAEAVKRTALAATDFSWLSKGDSVVIKPALNSGNPYPATTDPVSIRAMVKLLKEKGAGRVIITDLSGVGHVIFHADKLKGSSRKLMNDCGMAQAAEAAGAELYFAEEDGWDAFFPEKSKYGANWKGPIMMPKILQKVDHVVLMPRCSRHLMAGNSLGMKATVGWWRFDTRMEYHRDAATLPEKTAESVFVPSLLEKQRLVLTTATKVLTAFGPDNGYVSEPETGIVIASDSVVAHDMVSLAWLLENRKTTPEKEKKGRKDPYTGAKIVDFLNKQGVKMLGGTRDDAKATQKLVRNPINTVWDDRTLRRAFEILGGIPKLNLTVANKSVPESVLNALKDGVTPRV